MTLPLYLASQSPRRQQLLAQIGVMPTLLLPDVDEDTEALEAVHAGERPATYVQRVTAAKLQAAVTRHQRRGLAPGAILCADTTVALGRRILGKPLDAEDAAATLTRLSGRTHRVLTAVAVQAGPHQWQALQVSMVQIATLPPQVIQAYVASGEPFDKAGSYAIQGALAGWIVHISGSHSGIMGLPLFETAQLLRLAGVATCL